MSGRLANRRIRLLLAVFAIVFGATLLRAVWLQGVRAQSLGRMAASQHRQTVDVAANRGTIYDSTGVQLAVGEQAMTVYADPFMITEPRKVADITRAREILGFSPRIGLDTAIARTVEWYRGNPHGR